MSEKLEKAIDEAGRDRVFDYARALGWNVANPPPEWVWWNIVAELRMQPCPAPTAS